MDRLLRVWVQAISFRLFSLFQFKQLSGGGTAEIRLCQPLLLAVFMAVAFWYIARPTAVAIIAMVWLGGLLAGSYFWVRRMVFNLSAERHLQYAAVQVGDEIEEMVRLTNRSILPVLWAEFNDRSNIPDYTLTSARAVDGNSEQSWRAHSVCSQRGNYHFGPWELITGDPFGIFRVTITYHQTEEILVYPPLAVLPEQILPRGRTLGDERPLQMPLQAESISALTTRPLLPGDALRRIHWPTTARRNAPFVKILDPEAASTLWLIPDFDSSVMVGEGSNSTLEMEVILVASLADFYLSERLSVGLIDYAQTTKIIMPARGRAQFWQILRVLAGVQAAPKPFAETLAQAHTLISGRERIVAVTPSLRPEWAGQLTRLGPANNRMGVEVILLDPSSFLAPGSLTADTPLMGSGTALLPFLASLGISAHLLKLGDIQPLTASYGELNRWEFQTLGTGRAFARNSPRSRTGRVQTERP